MNNTSLEGLVSKDELLVLVTLLASKIKDSGDSIGIWAGPSADVDSAIQNGDIKDGYIVITTDDYESPDWIGRIEEIEGDLATIVDTFSEYLTTIFRILADAHIIYPSDLSGGFKRDIYVSTSEPTRSDGVNGDVWFVVEEVAAEETNEEGNGTVLGH